MKPGDWVPLRELVARPAQEGSGSEGDVEEFLEEWHGAAARGLRPT
jgi:hypothetical protein